MRFARSVAAILLGIVATVALVVLCTYFAIAMLLEPSPSGVSAYATPAFVAASLAYTPAAAAVGGWLTGRIARRRRVAHGALAGILMTMPIIFSQGPPGPGQPAWYPWLFAATVLMGTTVGAYLERESHG